MKHVKKAVAQILTGTALAVAASQAGAVSLPTAAYTQTDATTGVAYTNPTGNIITAGATSSASFLNYTTVKSWADMSIDLGWMHAVDWVQVNITDSGTYNIKSQVLGIRNAAGSANSANYTYTPMVLDTSIHPAFSIWSLNSNFDGSLAKSSANGANPISSAATHYTAPGNNNTMGFNQVATPTASNNGGFLLAGGVNDIVGYSNAGVGFVNGNGDTVGSGSTGASNGSGANGYLYTDLTTYLAAGSYLIASGGSCNDLVDCGPYQIKTSVATGATTTSYGTGWYQLSVTAVPVPGAVWLFGSALVGMIGFGRRKQALAV